MTDCGCGCQGAASGPATANPPGQRVLHRRASIHAAALERMRTALGAPDNAVAIRSLAWHSTDDPAIALLDSWAVVADIVAFYNERLATEGYLRTATERLSVRELARMLGYELRPGVAAQVDLAFTAETAAGAPEVVVVPKGTAVQSIPAAGELPQVFETSADLETRPPWNAIAAKATRQQSLRFNEDQIWVRGNNPGVRDGSQVLIVGAERAKVGVDSVSKRRAGGSDVPHGRAYEQWDFRTVARTVVHPDGRTGWTRLDLDHPIGFTPSRPLVAEEAVTVHLLTERDALFGWNAPDPNLMAGQNRTTPGASGDPLVWDDYDVTAADHPDVIEVDGDHTGIVAGSWIILEQPGLTEVYSVVTAHPDGASKFALSGRLTRVQVDVTANLSSFTRAAALVHASSVPLPAQEMPLVDEGVGESAELVVVATEPVLPPGRRILIQGRDYASGAALTESTVVLGCVPSDDGRTMTLTLDPPLAHTYRADTVSVRANVAAATHGETVHQVLGSGDGRVAYPQFSLRRAPLTYVRTTTAAGARAELSVRVDGVEWSEVPSLDAACSTSRVYAVRQDDGGVTRAIFGDGDHGARLPTGAENIASTYRVGIGAAGALKAEQVKLLVRRPLGIREVTNPAATHDWAPEEALEDARHNAPLRVRTLDRAVSVQDHEDFASGYAGVGQARADLVWDGRADLVVVTLLGVDAAPPSPDLVADLRTTLGAARDPGTGLVLLVGDVLWFGIRLEIAHDPAYERVGVEDAIRACLRSALGPGARPFAAPVSAAQVLVDVHAVPGVKACTMPRLFSLPDPPSPDPAIPPTLPSDSLTGTPRDDLLIARPARWYDESGALGAGILPAQLLGLAPLGVQVGVMPS